MAPKRIAIVGSGCSGIGALWALKESGHEVHLYEAADRLGGHTNTVEFRHRDRKVNVDTGFIVMNTATYPNFIAFLGEIGVPTVPTEMTFGVSRNQGQFEWAGTSLSSVFAQRSNIFSPSMWRMIFDIIRFNQYALDFLSEEVDISNMQSVKSNREETIGEYLCRNNYSDKFRNDYLIPMTACIWSTGPDKCLLEFPATTLIRFLWNHHLLNTITTRPPWLTIPGGSNQYIEAVMKDFPQDRVHLNTPVNLAKSDFGSVTLQTAGGFNESFDHVILAIHGDQALDLIHKHGTEEEISILNRFHNSKNTAILHSDLSLMPVNHLTWSSWNYLTRTNTSKTPTTVSLTYNMNILQHISPSAYGPVLVTLNPPHRPAAHLTQGKWDYAHPLYNRGAVEAQRQLPLIQNKRGISYCGAWTGYGFHEDGFTSGLRVAVEHLGAKVPFKVIDSTHSRGLKPNLRSRDRVARVLIWVIQEALMLWGLIWRLTVGMQAKVKSV